MTDLEKLAKGLSKAQRRALLDKMYYTGASHSFEFDVAGSTKNALSAMDIFDGWNGYLTLLGLPLREHLKGGEG